MYPPVYPGFLVADIAVNWVIVDRGCSAGRTGLGSAVLAGFVIGEELPAGSSFLGRLCLLSLTLLFVLLNSASTLHRYADWCLLPWLALCISSPSTCWCWLVWSLLFLVGVRWFWREA